MELKYILIGVFVIMLSISATATRSDWLSLVDNTDQCFDCYAVYEVCNPKGTKTAAEDVFNILWKDSTGQYIDPTTKKDIKTQTQSMLIERDVQYEEQVEVFQEQKIPYRCDYDFTYDSNWANCTTTNNTILWAHHNYDKINTNKQEVEVYEQVSTGFKTEIFTKKEWVNYPLTSAKNLVKLLDKDECLRFKITGNLKPNQAIDHIVQTGGYTFDEWAWWNSSWTYNQPLYVYQTSGSTYTDYVVKFEFTNSNTGANFNWSNNGADLRFLNSTEDGELDYFIDDWNSTLNTSTVWVRIPSLPNGTNTTIYMYYGNSEATTTSDGFSTFPIYDDFTGASLNTSKWDCFISADSPLNDDCEFQAANDRVYIHGWGTGNEKLSVHLLSQINLTTIGGLQAKARAKLTTSGDYPDNDYSMIEFVKTSSSWSRDQWSTNARALAYRPTSSGSAFDPRGYSATTYTSNATGNTNTEGVFSDWEIVFEDGASVTGYVDGELGVVHTFIEDHQDDLYLAIGMQQWAMTHREQLYVDEIFATHYEPSEEIIYGAEAEDSAPLPAGCDYGLDACKTSGWVADSTYCLTDNLTANVCMEVDANNVTIDGQGHWINGPTSGFGTYTGVKFYGFDDCSIYNTTINGYKTFGGVGLRLANTDRTTVSSVYLNNSYLTLSASGQTTNNMTLVNVQMEDSQIAATLGTHTGNRFIWNNSYGEIRFTEEITGSINSDIVFGVGGSVELSTNYAYLDSNIDELSNLAANITLYNTGITTPVILKDGVTCSDCVILSSDGDNHTFNVTSWSNYTLEEAPPLEIIINSAQNQTITTTSHTFNITINQDVMCNLSRDGTIFQNTTNATNFLWDQTLSEQNYTEINYTCTNENGTTTSDTYWLNVALPPTINWSSTMNQSMLNQTYNISIIGSEALSSCLLELDGAINVSMTSENTTSYFYEYTSAIYTNKTFQAFCNDTSDVWGVSTISWVDMDQLVVTWGDWDGLNETTTASSTTINWTTNYNANCTLNFNTSLFENITTQKYQEFANATFVNGSLDDSDKAFDGLWSTYAYNPDVWGLYMFMNYTKPAGVSSVSWVSKVDGNNSIEIHELCVNTEPIQLRVEGFAQIPQNAWEVTCRNGTNEWSGVDFRADFQWGASYSGAYFYEEAVWFTFPNNTYTGTKFEVDVNNQDPGNYSSISVTCSFGDETAISTTSWWNITTDTATVTFGSWEGYNSQINASQITINWTTNSAVDNCTVTFDGVSETSATHPYDTTTYDGGGVSDYVTLEVPKDPYATVDGTTVELYGISTGPYYGDPPPPTYSKYEYNIPQACWDRDPTNITFEVRPGYDFGMGKFRCLTSTDWVDIGLFRQDGFVNLTVYWGNSVNFSKTITTYEDTNHTINVSCMNENGNSNVAQAWTYTNTIGFISPTPANGSSVAATPPVNLIQFNVTTQFPASQCLLDYNGTNISMSTTNGTNHQLNKTANVDGNYTVKAYCNSTATLEYYVSESRTYTIIGAMDIDLDPPEIVYTYPADGQIFTSDFARLPLTIAIYTNEEVLSCKHSTGVFRDWDEMAPMSTLNGLDPAYRHTISSTFPVIASSLTEFIQCEDLEGNLMSEPYELTFHVSSSTSGGGGGPAEIIVVVEGNETTFYVGDYILNPTVSFDSEWITYDSVYNQTIKSTIPIESCNFEKFSCAIKSDPTKPFPNTLLELTYVGADAPNTPGVFIEEKGSICAQDANNTCKEFHATLQGVNLNWRVPRKMDIQVAWFVSPNGINIFPTLGVVCIIIIIWSTQRKPKKKKDKK